MKKMVCKFLKEAGNFNRRKLVTCMKFYVFKVLDAEMSPFLGHK